jgi:uncharacterized protein (DUF1330 family)
MAAYVIAEVEITDPVAYEEYRRQVPATIAAFGGRFVVRAGRYEVVEGTWEPARLVILEFDSLERAQAWHASPEYQAVKAIRDRTAHTRHVILAEGV